MKILYGHDIGSDDSGSVINVSLKQQASKSVGSGALKIGGENEVKALYSNAEQKSIPSTFMVSPFITPTADMDTSFI
jgi:hypothetical protein